MWQICQDDAIQTAHSNPGGATVSDHKINFFGSFLDTMKTPSGSPPPAGNPAAALGATDAVLHLLNECQGQAEINELLPLTGSSVTALIDTINTLGSFGLLKREGSVVQITPASLSAAQAKRSV
jgi:hypothetical protein